MAVAERRAAWAICIVLLWFAWQIVTSEESIKQQQQQLQPPIDGFSVHHPEHRMPIMITTTKTTASPTSTTTTSTTTTTADPFPMSPTNTSAGAPSLFDQLPKNDFNKLIDLDDFNFTINQKPCNDQPPLLLILVHSGPENWQKRNTIRETWGTSDPMRTRLIFLMGAVNTAGQQLRIEQENRFFDDIVQGSFQDAYRNLTYKHVMALKWHTYHCPQAPYVLKTDDDVFVNMPRLIGMLMRTVGTDTGGGRKELLWCSKVQHALVRRSFRSKWRVSAAEFADKFYPDHCPGFVILYSADVVRRLYTTAQVTPYFWVDDVHITGVVAGKLNITITSFKNYYVTDNEQQHRLVSGAARDEDLSFIIAQPNLSGKDIKELWKAVLPKKRDSR